LLPHREARLVDHHAGIGSLCNLVQR
jgi:hypothetical protein